MAVVQIPNLPYSISLNGGELLEAVQNGVSVRVSSQQIANLYSQNIGGSTYVTLNQFMLAVAATQNADVLFQAMSASFQNPATIQFYTSAYVPIGSPIYVLTQQTFPGIDMDALIATAYAQPLWG